MQFIANISFINHLNVPPKSQRVLNFFSVRNGRGRSNEAEARNVFGHPEVSTQRRLRLDIGGKRKQVDLRVQGIHLRGYQPRAHNCSQAYLPLGMPDQLSGTSFISFFCSLLNGEINQKLNFNDIRQ